MVTEAMQQGDFLYAPQTDGNWNSSTISGLRNDHGQAVSFRRKMLTQADCSSQVTPLVAVEPGTSSVATLENLLLQLLSAE